MRDRLAELSRLFCVGYPPQLTRTVTDYQNGVMVSGTRMTEMDFRRCYGHWPWLELPDGSLVRVWDDNNITLVETR